MTEKCLIYPSANTGSKFSVDTLRSDNLSGVRVKVMKFRPVKGLEPTDNPSDCLIQKTISTNRQDWDPDNPDTQYRRGQLFCESEGRCVGCASTAKVSAFRNFDCNDN